MIHLIFTLFLALPTLSFGQSGELIDLLEVDYNTRPDLIAYTKLLHSSLQILRFNPERGRAATQSKGAAILPVGHHDNPYDRELVSVCSASFLSGNRVATATHCLRTKKEDLSSLLVFRKHKYEIKNGRLVVVGFEDFRLKPGSALLRLDGDTSILSLADGSAPSETFQTLSNADQQLASQISIIGYPNHFYGRPHLSFKCAIDFNNAVTVGFGTGPRSLQCHTEGGMSGGPVFFEQTGFPQISTVSSSGGAGEEGHYASGGIIITE